jgi:hypothetical protein
VSVGDQPYSQLHPSNLFVTALSSTLDAVGSARSKHLCSLPFSSRLHAKAI